MTAAVQEKKCPRLANRGRQSGTGNNLLQDYYTTPELIYTSADPSFLGLYSDGALLAELESRAAARLRILQDAERMLARGGVE